MYYEVIAHEAIVAMEKRDRAAYGGYPRAAAYWESVRKEIEEQLREGYAAFNPNEDIYF